MESPTSPPDFDPAAEEMAEAIRRLAELGGIDDVFGNLPGDREVSEGTDRVGKVVWHVTMSLDGFIAGPGDAMDWVFRYVGPNPVADEVIARTGALLIGHRTYRGAKTEAGKPYGGAWSGPMFVLTRDDPSTAAPGFTFVRGDLTSVVAAAKAAAGTKDLVIFGANTAQQCLAAGLVDEILIHLAPLMLGDGIRLFGRSGTTPIELETIDVTRAGQITNLCFRVIRATTA
jgi:dihydrofolate reductase